MDDARRQAARASVVLALHYRSAGHLLVNYCANLSRGGVFVPTELPPPSGTRLTLELRIPGERAPTRLDAEVRWVRQFDTDAGPAGMGLSFEDIDARLGERIDALVTKFKPLQVHVIGNNASVRDYVAAQVRALVTCETHEHASALGLVDRLIEADLVLVDTNADPNEGVALLRALAARSNPPPCVALCDAAVKARHEDLQPLAHVVDTPVDTADLRSRVLEALTEVHAHARLAPQS